MKLVLVGCLLLLLTLASAETYQLHLLRTGNNTYVWTDDMSPKLCASTSSGSCNITLKVTKCNNTTIDLHAIKDINKTIGALKTDLSSMFVRLGTISSNITSLGGNVVTMDRVSTLNEKLKSDLNIMLGSSMDERLTKIEETFSKTELAHNLEINLTQCRGQLSTSQVESAGLRTSLEDSESASGNMFTALIIVIGMLLLVVAWGLNLLSPLRRNVGV